MVIRPKIRGFVCVTCHPLGCEKNVREQIDLVLKRGPLKEAPKKVLVVGSSTGYGLACRISAAFGGKADTVGVFFEREPANGRLGTPGFYNNKAFEEAAREAGMGAWSWNGDAFSHEAKKEVCELIKEKMGSVDLLIYSLASPRRTDPVTGTTHKSVLKPIGQSFTGKSLNTDKNEVIEVSMDPAADNEIEDTIKVMGGEDWESWVQELDRSGLLGEGFQTTAFSYIGPEVTWPIYTEGTIGRAKKDLEETARRLDAVAKLVRGSAWVTVNKAVVTQASAAIPVVPLYLSILFKVMKEKDLHEGCIEQMQRFFAQCLSGERFLDFDDQGRIRMDDWEMRSEIQEAVREIWPRVHSENLCELTDYQEYQSEFLKLFGFGIPGVDYEADYPV